MGDKSLNNKILVSGGAGYIGSHACQALAAAGYVPISFDNLSTGHREAVKFGPFFEGDLTNPTDVESVFEIYRPMAVMHFAAFSQVNESMKNPGLYWKNNVLGSLNLIQSAVNYDCENFVFSSTCATFGDQDNVVLDENSNQEPINAYGASKRAAEDILANFGKRFSLKYVILRYFNVAGADPSGVIGEFHQPETHLIPILIDVLTGGRDAITIHGTDYDTPDGTCIRDYVHVSDLIDAHLLGLEWLLSGNQSRSFNLGTGKGFSVREVVNHLMYLTNSSMKVVEGPRRPGDCSKLVSGSHRAKQELGWTPIRSNLDNMLMDAMRWHKSNEFSTWKNNAKT